MIVFVRRPWLSLGEVRVRLIPNFDFGLSLGDDVAGAAIGCGDPNCGCSVLEWIAWRLLQGRRPLAWRETHRSFMCGSRSGASS